MIQVILMYAIFASSFPLTKILLSYTQPFFLTGVRMIIGGGILLFYYTIYRKNKCTVARTQYFVYAQIIFIGFYLNYIARFWSINYLSSAKAGLIFTLYPLISSLLSYFFFNETVSKKQWLGFTFGLCSVAPLLVLTSPAEITMGQLWIFSWPELAMLASVVADCYKWILMRKLVLDRSCSPFMVNGLCMTAGGLLALLTAFPTEGLLPVTSLAPFIIYMGLYILISNVISYNLYGFLLRTYTVTFLSLAGFMAPLFAALYGWLFLHEHISWHFYISATMLACGLYLFYQDELRNKTLNQDTLLLKQ